MTGARAKTARSKASPPGEAKLFWSGRSQAVRLPKEFRFEGKSVKIRREGQRVIIEPVEDQWAWLDKITGEFDPSFEEAINEEVPQQERPELDDLFK
jgi:antitoxin VapB